MRFTSLLLSASAILAASAQNSTNSTSICDKYTTALLMENNATNQYTLLTVVNTAVIGNYTMPNVGIAVPGILNPNGTYNGTAVNLVPYFSGALASTNDNGTAKALNFLDGGGAAPLMMNMAANSNTTVQYALLTHLYQYFGLLLGCSAYGTEGFPAYQGNTNMYSVHKFMDLSAAEMGYFITQVGLSAASFGVAEEDVMAVGMALNSLFNVRCSPPVSIVPGAPAQLQQMCDAESCQYGANGTDFCNLYPAPVGEPVAANSTNTLVVPSGGVSSVVPSGVASAGAMSAAASQSAMMSAASAQASSMVAAVKNRRRRVL